MTEATVEVFAVGSEVTLCEGVSALVTAVCLRAGQSVTYEVVWWDDRTRRREWVAAAEVTAGGGSRREFVGFRGW